MATIFGRVEKLFQQLGKLSDEAVDHLIEGGYFSALREAEQTGRLPERTSFRQMLGLDTCLRLNGHINLPVQLVGGTFRPGEFYKTRDGLRVIDSSGKIVPVSGVITGTLTRRISSFGVNRHATNAEIRADLPDDHVFQGDDFWFHLAGMITRQSTRTDDSLFVARMNRQNVFFIESARVVVVVSVEYTDDGWDIHVSDSSVDFCSRGDLVFSASPAD